MSPSVVLAIKEKKAEAKLNIDIETLNSHRTSTDVISLDGTDNISDTVRIHIWRKMLHSYKTGY